MTRVFKETVKLGAMKCLTTPLCNTNRHAECGSIGVKCGDGSTRDTSMSTNTFETWPGGVFHCTALTKSSHTSTTGPSRLSSRPIRSLFRSHLIRHQMFAHNVMSALNPKSSINTSTRTASPHLAPLSWSHAAPHSTALPSFPQLPCHRPSRARAYSCRPHTVQSLHSRPVAVRTLKPTPTIGPRSRRESPVHCALVHAPTVPKFLLLCNLQLCCRQSVPQRPHLRFLLGRHTRLVPSRLVRHAPLYLYHSAYHNSHPFAFYIPPYPLNSQPLAPSVSRLTPFHSNPRSSSCPH